MPNGIKVLSELKETIALTQQMDLSRDGNTFVLKIMGQYMDTNPISSGVPTNIIPSSGIIAPVLINRTGGPTHVIGYASLRADGYMDVIEPSGGTYIQPTGVTIYGEIVWILP